MDNKESYNAPELPRAKEFKEKWGDMMETIRHWEQTRNGHHVANNIWVAKEIERLYGEKFGFEVIWFCTPKNFHGHNEFPTITYKPSLKSFLLLTNVGWVPFPWMNVAAAELEHFGYMEEEERCLFQTSKKYDAWFGNCRFWLVRFPNGRGDATNMDMEDFDGSEEDNVELAGDENWCGCLWFDHEGKVVGECVHNLCENNGLDVSREAFADGWGYVAHLDLRNCALFRIHGLASRKLTFKACRCDGLWVEHGTELAFSECKLTNAYFHKCSNFDFITKCTMNGAQFVDSTLDGVAPTLKTCVWDRLQIPKKEDREDCCIIDVAGSTAKDLEAFKSEEITSDGYELIRGGWMDKASVTYYADASALRTHFDELSIVINILDRLFQQTITSDNAKETTETCIMLFHLLFQTSNTTLVKLCAKIFKTRDSSKVLDDLGFCQQMRNLNGETPAEVLTVLRKFSSSIRSEYFMFVKTLQEEQNNIRAIQESQSRLIAYGVSGAVTAVISTSQFLSTYYFNDHA